MNERVVRPLFAAGDPRDVFAWPRGTRGLVDCCFGRGTPGPSDTNPGS